MKYIKVFKARFFDIIMLLLSGIFTLILKLFTAC